MRINVDVTMHYRFACPNTVFLALEAAHTDGQEIVEEQMRFDDAVLTRISGDAGVARPWTYGSGSSSTWWHSSA